MNNCDIIKIYGTDYKNMTKELLNRAALADDIGDKVRIGIKPNLVSPTPALFGATTHPEIVEGIIEYLKEHGKNDISIIEGSWIGDKTEDAFDYCGYNNIKEKYGITLIDTQKDSSYSVDCADYSLNICSCYKDIDYLINVPVLKGHCQTLVTCALKNMKGLIPNSEKRRFHTMGLHAPIAYLNTYIKQNFIIVDHICGDLNYEDGGNPCIRNCIMCGKDPVLIDTYSSTLIGVDPENVQYIKLSEELKVGSCDLSKLNLTTLGDESWAKNDVPILKDDRILDVKYATCSIDTCSACYASYVDAMLRLKEEGYSFDTKVKIAIGQGHKDKKGRYGIGNCTKGYEYYVSGCPADADKIYEALKAWDLLHK